MLVLDKLAVNSRQQLHPVGLVHHYRRGVMEALGSALPVEIPRHRTTTNQMQWENYNGLKDLQWVRVNINMLLPVRH